MLTGIPLKPENKAVSREILSIYQPIGEVIHVIGLFVAFLWGLSGLLVGVGAGNLGWSSWAQKQSINTETASAETRVQTKTLSWHEPSSIKVWNVSNSSLDLIAFLP